MNEEVRRTAGYLKKGLVILYPTDTIWGIGCDASNPEAVSRVYRIKRRTDRKSMLVLIDHFSRLSFHIDVIPDRVRNLIDQAEKPVTIIYPGAKNLAENLIAEDGSIGIRITSDSFCQRLVQRIGKPIVSTSANFSGKKAPSSFAEIDPEMLKEVDYVVNWRRGETEESAPSSILKVDLEGNVTVIRSH